MPRLHPLRFPLALVLALGLFACGDDAPAPTPTPSPSEGPGTPVAETPAAEPNPIRFLEGLAAGRAAADDPDALLFVYLARHKPT